MPPVHRNQPLPSLRTIIDHGQHCTLQAIGRTRTKRASAIAVHIPAHSFIQPVDGVCRSAWLIRWLVRFVAQGGQALVHVKHGEHEFEKVVLVHPAGKASVEIYLHGATVTSWKILGQEMLYLSPQAIFAPGKAIRGGIPVVFRQLTTMDGQHATTHAVDQRMAAQ